MTLVLVCEGPDDNRVIRAMLPNVLRQDCDWLEAEHCGFQGLNESDEFLAWKYVDREYKACFPGNFGVAHMGHFNGQPASPDAHCARKVLRILNQRGLNDAGIIMVRDQDTHTSDRLSGLLQARDESVSKAEAKSTLPPVIAIGLARPKVEAWVLAGFEAQSDAEVAALCTESAVLSFDPTRAPHRIRSQATGNDRDIKRVLESLTGGDHEREAAAAGNIDRICLHGRDTGAVEFIEECKGRLAPLFGAAPRRN